LTFGRKLEETLMGFFRWLFESREIRAKRLAKEAEDRRLAPERAQAEIKRLTEERAGKAHLIHLVAHIELVCASFEYNGTAFRKAETWDAWAESGSEEEAKFRQSLPRVGDVGGACGVRDVRVEVVEEKWVEKPVAVAATEDGCNSPKS
jgi:hypothetical protein